MLLFYQSSLIIQSSTHQVTSFEDFKSHQIIFVLFLSASLKKCLADDYSAFIKKITTFVSTCIILVQS